MKYKNNGVSDYLGSIINESFLQGQLELYKREFAETGNNRYLEVMNQLNATIITFRHMRETIDRLARENIKLKK
tara:strand:+ start:617 stop:838 length:222 start_codon:yes stop_codon:yes gene_type:complete